MGLASKIPDWHNTRQTVLTLNGWRCQHCGKAGRLEVHHVKPLKDGGAARDQSNLIPLCVGCHVAAHKRPETPERGAWRQMVDEL